LSVASRAAMEANKVGANKWLRLIALCSCRLPGGNSG
jgi:hypothetical protein